MPWPRAPRSWEGWLFALACAATLLPLWLVPYFPSQDGAAHVDTAHALLRYHDAALPYREYYALNLRPGPNTLVALLLAGLMLVFDPVVAEKLVVSGYILLFALGARYALAAVAPENRWLALFAPLLVYNVTLHMGFFNFAYSTALFAFVLGYWMRRHPRWTPGSTLALAALVLLLYLLHPISMVMAAAAIGVSTLWPWRGWRAALPPAAAFLVPALAALVFLTRGARIPDYARGSVPRFRLDDLLFLRSFDVLETWFCVAVPALLLVLIACRSIIRSRAEGAREHRHGLLVAAALYAVIYLLTPDFMAGGGFIKMRLAIYPVLALLLWTGATRYPTWLRLAVQGLVAVVLVFQVSFYTSRYAAIDEGLAEYDTAGDRIARGSTVLTLCFDPWGPAPAGSRPLHRVAPLMHATGRLAAERDLVNLMNSQGNYDYFALAFRPERNTYTHITGGQESIFTDMRPIDFLSYPARTGGRVDYVLIWGLRRELLRSRAVQGVGQQLREGYDRIFVSSGGHLELYRRKDLAGRG